VESWTYQFILSRGSKEESRTPGKEKADGFPELRSSSKYFLMIALSSWIKKTVSFMEHRLQRFNLLASRGRIFP